MKILAIEHERAGVTTDEFGQYSATEALRVWEMHQQGIIRELYFRTDRNEVVLVLECDSVETAQHVLATLPLVQNGLIDFELIPLKAYPGFERLFSHALLDGN